MWRVGQFRRRWGGGGGGEVLMDKEDFFSIYERWLMQMEGGRWRNKLEGLLDGWCFGRKKKKSQVGSIVTKKNVKLHGLPFLQSYRSEWGIGKRKCGMGKLLGWQWSRQSVIVSV